jgi:uncharacterized protein YfaS (alpha-2-macroglobulin family)
MIHLSETINGFESGQEIEEKLFDFSPSIKGKTIMIDEQTFEFIPESRLKHNQSYEATFDIGAVVPEGIEKENKIFEFSFQTIQPSFYLVREGLQVYEESDGQNYFLSWELRTADYADNAEVEKILSVSGIKSTVKWEHENSRTHRFIIDSIRAGEKAFEIELNFDAKSIGGDKKEEISVRVPSKYEFSLMGVEIKDGDGEQYVLCRFSSYLDSKQSLLGIITLGDTRLNYRIVKNTVLLYPSTTLKGKVQLTIRDGLLNAAGGKFAQVYFEELYFETYNPEVRFIGKGNILPDSDGLSLPFQAVSLRAVRVSIIKVYEKNVLQFLQVNKLDGKRELKRAGRLVCVKTIRLDEKTQEKDLRRWGTYAVDLAKIIEPEQGAIYRIELSFSKQDAIIDCKDQDNSTNSSVKQNSNTDEEFLANQLTEYDNQNDGSDYYYYDYYGDDDFYYGNDYNNRNNPCSEAYYGKSRTVARNIFASNFGIIAKMGTDKKLRAAVTDLVTLNPVGEVTLEIYNYQQQVVGKATTGSDGFAELDVAGKPFVLMATQGAKRGYLQMLDGHALSLSRFDVAGSSIQNGLKGYIYGERGVWRPGDTIFLTFILKDQTNKLPPNHPVSMEIVNPSGQVVNKQTKTSSQNGFYTFTYKTDDDAPTGNWYAAIQVGGVVFNKTLKIETIKPNRLKINLNFDSETISLSQGIKGTLSSAWLHGSPAKNLKSDIAMYLQATVTKFNGFDGYVFDDPTKIFDTEEKSFYSGQLNQDGELKFSGKVELGSQPAGKLKANFVTRVFEEGGEFSIDNISKDLSPYSSYVGIAQPKGTGYMNMLETDKNQAFDLISLDENGKTIDKKVRVEVHKLGWSWWWSSSNNQLANFSQNRFTNLVHSEELNTSDGRSSFIYKAKHNEYGFYLIIVTDLSSKHSAGTLAYFDWPNWGGRPRQGSSEGATMLIFTADKDKYKVGEVAKILVPSASGAKALVSIENGSRILQTYWLDTKEEQTEVNIMITPEMCPNIYIFVTLVQPHAQTKNDMPIRLYGVIPVKAEDPETRLTPVIDMPSNLRPEEKYKISVRETDGKPMSYTLAVVDEGLLDLTRFATPNPWNYFYSTEALGVKTWDMYDEVIGAYGGRIEQLFAIGGDDAAAVNRTKVNRFKPVVNFIGPFTLGKNKTLTHEFTMPNYSGSVRVMVVAGNDKAYGSAEKTVPVKKPLMVIATLPRVLGPGEEVDLQSIVFAMEKNIKKVDIKVEANELFTVKETLKSINFDAIGDKLTPFRLKVNERIGKGTVKVIASSGNERSEYNIEIEIRNANPPVNKVETLIMEPGQSRSINCELPGMDGTNKGILEASFIPPINLGTRLSYLITYPHGCIEQTTSSVFPQLYLASVIELSEADKKSAENNIKAGVERLRSFLTLDGGFSYWPGEREVNRWGTSYAGDFLLEAEKKGYAIPANIKSNWIKFQQREARNWTPKNEKGSYYSYGQSDLDQAYRLYTLAKAKSAETGAMNRLKEYPTLSIQARWTLAAAYALSGQMPTANKLVENAKAVVSDYPSSFSQTYGSSSRDYAMICDALVLINRRTDAFAIVRKLSSELNGSKWMSTQTTAYSLMAISRYAETEKSDKSLELEYKYSGKSGNVNSRKTFWKSDLGSLSNDLKMDFVNKSKNVIFVQVTSTGIPAAGNEVAAQNKLKIECLYLADKAIDPEKIIQGSDFIAQVKVTNISALNEDVTNIALTQIFPSGWEIMNTRLFGIDGASSDYCDIRDDRVYTYFKLSAGESKVFKVRLNAAYTGRFYMPAIKAEAMYDGSINANSVGKWVEVVKN